MAQQLTTGLNFFELSLVIDNNAIDVIGNSIPTDFNSQGIAKQDGETGFFISSEKSYTIYIYYNSGTWIQYGTVDVTDEDYGTGVNIPWLEDLTHGLPMAAYFVTTESEHEVRIFSKTGRISADLLPGDSDIDKGTLIHSLADIAIDDDGKITGRSAISEFSVDTTNFGGGDTITFTHIGDFWHGMVLVNKTHEIPSNISYNAASDQTEVTFELPNIHDSSHDRYSINLSLKESVPAVQKFILTANTYVIDENGEVTITLSTQNVTAGTALPWTISGTGIDSNDFSQGDFLDATALTGEFVVGTTDSVSFTMDEDLTTEGSEVFTLSLDGGQANVSIVVNDTSTTPAAAATHGLKMAVIVGDSNYGDGGLQYRLGGRGNYTEINWGDGNTESFQNNNSSQQSYDSIEHSYSSPGTYIIEVKGDGVLNPIAPHHLSTKWNRSGMPLYDVTLDTGNVGPFGMNRPAIELDFSTVTGLNVSGSTMTITDSANTDWASIVTGASYSDAIGGAMQILVNNERYWSEITSAVTTGNTTTITIASGGFYAESVGDLEDVITADGATSVINDLITYPIQMVLRPNLTQHPNFQVYNVNYGVTRGMWDLDRNLPVVSHALKLTQITHWGTDFTHSIYSGGHTKFSSCINMDITATDYPDFTNLTSLKDMFLACESLVDSNNSLNNSLTCGSNITTLENTFNGCSFYNGDLDNWDTSNVTSMFRTFKLCRVFNGNVETWNTSNVTSMYGMFRQCDLFNRDVNTKVRADGQLAWDVDSCSNFTIMFGRAYAFNQSLDKWRPNGGTFNQMFSYASSFNQDLLTQQVTVGGTTYVAWDTSGVYNFYHTFNQAPAFNGDISNWDTGKSQTFFNMFYNAAAFNQDIDTKSVTVPGIGTYDAWNTKCSISGVAATKFKAMFYGAVSFNQDLNNWDVTDGTNFNSMFYNAYSFNGDISAWDVSGKTSFSSMFLRAWNFNQDIGGWNTSSATALNQMFYMAYSFDQDLNNWDVSNVYTFDSMFRSARKKTGITGDWNFNNWSIKQSGTVNMQYMFGDYSNNSTYDASPYGGGIVTTSEPMWSPLIDQWNTSYVTKMNSMFTYRSNLESVQNIDVSSWDTQRLTDMNSIFYGATHGIQGTENWNLPVLQNAGAAYFATNLGNVDLSNIGIGGNLTNIQSIFYGLSGDYTGLGMENWDVSDCTSLAQLQWNGNLPNFNPDITNWNVSNVTKMSQMLYNCPAFNQDLSNWDVSNVTTFHQAFYACPILDFDPSAWNISNVLSMSSMFYQGALTWNQARLDNVMSSWGAQTVQNDVPLTIQTGGGASISALSTAGLAGYNNLVNNYNWNIGVS